jgi:hypothetical protein
MIDVEIKPDGKLAVTMNGTEYHFPNAADRAAFVLAYTARTSITTIADLVGRFLDKLQRVARRIVSEVLWLARQLADSDNYWRGIGAASYQEMQRYV